MTSPHSTLNGTSSAPFHPPLRRVARGPKVMVCPTDRPQRLLMPMASAPPGLQSAAELRMAPATASPGSRGIMIPLASETHDSCYSSCSDSDHSNLSREVSETLGAGGKMSTGGNACERSQSLLAELSLVTLTNVGQAMPVDTAAVVVDYQKAKEFTVKLGYTEDHLEMVLAKLGREPMPEHDRILSELVKLGKKGRQPVPSSTKTAADGDSPSSGVGERQQLTSAISFPLMGTPIASQCRSDVIKDGCGQPKKPQLRSIVIDGSNLAMTHGRKEVFSCGGIKSCVAFFQAKGHTDLNVFVPQFRKENPRADCPITDQHILFELEAARILVWTPSRRVGGRRIVCHDDRYILKTALEKDAVIVSNDEYRDLAKENPTYRRLIEERLLMYSFVDGKFMPPDDPLGRHGPRLDQFLSSGGPTSASSTSCPYGKKCTYGNKCKFYHPDRPGGVHVSVTERIIGDVGRKPLSATASLGFDHQHGASSPVRLARRQPVNHHSQTPPAQPPPFHPVPPALHMRQHLGALRTNSMPLNLITTSTHYPSANGTATVNSGGLFDVANRQAHIGIGDDSAMYAQPPPGFERYETTSTLGGRYSHSGEPASLLRHSLRQRHSQLVDECFYPKQTASTPDIAAANGHYPACTAAEHQGLLLVPSQPGHHHLLEHMQLNRNMSAPCAAVGRGGDCGSYATEDRSTAFVANGALLPFVGLSDEHKSSMSDTQLNWQSSMPPTVADVSDDRRDTLCRVSSSDSAFGSDGSSHSNYFVPSTAVWGPSELSVASSLSPASSTDNKSGCCAVGGGGTVGPSVEDERRKLFYHLSQLFNESVVTAVMNAHPEENDAQVLCSKVLGVQKGFAETTTVDTSPSTTVAR